MEEKHTLEPDPSKPGPKTEAGKAISSQNALKHGLTAATVRLHSEEQQLLDAAIDEYLADWQPVGRTERDLVIQLATCYFRMERIRAMETSYVDYNTGLVLPTVRKIEGHDAPLAQSMSYEKAARHIDFLGRHEARLDRMAREARKQLILLQDRRKKADTPPPPANAKKSQNESPIAKLPKLLSINDIIRMGLAPGLGPNSDWNRSLPTLEAFKNQITNPPPPDSGPANHPGEASDDVAA